MALNFITLFILIAFTFEITPVELICRVTIENFNNPDENSPAIIYVRGRAGSPTSTGIIGVGDILYAFPLIVPSIGIIGATSVSPIFPYRFAGGVHVAPISSEIVI